MNFRRATIPLLASPQGGVAARVRKWSEASLIARTGWFSDCEQKENHLRTKGKPLANKRKTTPAASLRWLREIFLMTQPPLLAVMQGGEFSLDGSLFTAS
jgi:hypothetical protein